MLVPHNYYSVLENGFNNKTKVVMCIESNSNGISRGRIVVSHSEIAGQIMCGDDVCFNDISVVEKYGNLDHFKLACPEYFI